MSIKTLSPHYITIPLTNPVTGVICSSYTVNVFIWVGSKSAPPATPSYTMTKINAAGLSGTEKINISRIANDFIEFDCDPQLDTVIVDGNNQAWVRHQVFYDDTPYAPINSIQLATKGYGFFLEGANPQLPNNKILLTGDEFKVSRNGLFVLPFMVEETVVVKTLSVLEFFKIKDNVYGLELSADFSFTDLTVFVRPVGGSSWTELEPFGSDYLVPTIIAATVFEVMITAVDTETGDLISSDVYTITALKITKIIPSDGGHAIVVYYTSNIGASSYVLQIYGYSGPSWSNTTSGATSLLYLSFTPTGNFKARVNAGTNYSNEVEFTIPLTDEIIIS